VLILLILVTAIYQRRPTANLMNLFGLYLLIGVLGAFYFFKVMLPAIGDMITTAMVDSGEEPEEPPMVRIRSLIAEGDYDSAAEELVHVAAANPGDRIPWIERADLLDGKLSDSVGAVQTLEIGLKSYEWNEEDAAFFLFKIFEIHEKRHARKDAMATLDRIVEGFPSTRYSANAVHKKRELTGDGSKNLTAGPPGSPMVSPPVPGKDRISPPPPSKS
jgi:hypothetical protein